MVCPYCNCKTSVSNSRTQKRVHGTWRRRHCKKCQTVFTTTELANYETIWLVDYGDMQTVPFSRDRLFLSIYRCLSTSNRVYNAQMLTDTVIKMLLGAHQAIIPVSRLQDSVFNTLRHFEPPAALKYVTDRSRHISKAELRNKIKDLDLA